jgi:alkanesulfonate monooxygenase SsuD/methylene tetrahydromethanopterin reductase-like flavin-dependent oxidoreductase (luciferase family)
VSDYGHALQFGVFITPSAAGGGAVVDLAVLADASGLDLVTFQDHPYQARFLDTWTLLAVVAARTSRVHVAPNVLNLPLRPPAVVARAAASLDILSGGRFELGLGAGAFWDGIEAMGGPRRTPGQSVDALEEAIDVIRAVWSGERSVRAGGEHYHVDGLHPGPVPAHRMGIWLGAYGPRMMRVTGRLADGWLPSVPRLPLEEVMKRHAAIDEAARSAGRDPSEIRRVANANVAGDASDWADWPQELIRLATDYRFETLIVWADGGDDPVGLVRRIGEDVAPRVRAALGA